MKPTSDPEEPAAPEGRAGGGSEGLMGLAEGLGGVARMGLLSCCAALCCYQTRETTVISALNRWSPPKHRDRLLCAAFMNTFVHYYGCFLTIASSVPTRNS